MKWLFLSNEAPFLTEFFGKLQEELLEQGDQCLNVFHSKVSEFRKRKFLPEKTTVISKVDWCLEHYDESQSHVSGVSWKDFFPVFERFKNRTVSFEESMRIIKSTYQFFDYIFTHEKPDIILGEIPTDIFHEIAYVFSQKNKIPYISIEDSKFENRIDTYEGKFVCKRCELDFNSKISEQLSQKDKDAADKFIKDLTEHTISLGSDFFTSIKVSQFNLLKHYGARFFIFLKIWYRYLKKRKHYKAFDYESENIIKRSLVSIFKAEQRQIRIFLQRNTFEKADLNSKFFLYPLPFQPEATSIVYATYYVNQLETVKNICFALPFPYKLYIKEHPWAVGSRPADFYKKIKDIPNAQLILPSENVKELIEKSTAVITLNSTMGLEAALLGKKAYLLGNVYYSYHSLCEKIGSFSDLKNSIEKYLKENHDPMPDLADMNRRFIHTYFMNTVKGRVFAASGRNDHNNYKQIVDDFKTIATRITTENIC